MCILLNKCPKLSLLKHILEFRQKRREGQPMKVRLNQNSRATCQLRITTVYHHKTAIDTVANDLSRPLHTILLLLTSQCLCSNCEARLFLQIAALVAKQRQRLHSPNIPWRLLCRPRRILLRWPGPRYTTRKKEPHTIACFMREALIPLVYKTNRLREKETNRKQSGLWIKSGLRSWHTGKTAN